MSDISNKVKQYIIPVTASVLLIGQCISDGIPKEIYNKYMPKKPIEFYDKNLNILPEFEKTIETVKKDLEIYKIGNNYYKI